MKNYGLNLVLERQEQKLEDWVFGSSGKECLALIPSHEREEYLPKGEVQRAIEDTMDCASRGPLNILEAKFTWLYRNKKLSTENHLWLMENGYVDLERRVTFSDAFVAINSLTTREGNSLRAPLDAIRKHGLIPKKLLSLESWMTWEDYHDPQRITPRLKKLGQEFAQRFFINYEKVYEKDFEALLEKDFLNVAGFAWPDEIDGVFYRTSLDPNHCFIVWKTPKYYAFDNYTDSDGDFIKRLAPDYDLMDYGYRVMITGEGKRTKKSCLGAVTNFIKEIFTK